MDPSTPLRRLQVFCLVVDGGGVTRAAERLHVSQPAVSAQLRALEQSLGAQLLNRAGNAMELTEVGERVYDWAQEVLVSGQQLQQDVDQLAGGERGSLVVAASMGIGTYLMPPVLTALRARRPQAEITLHVSEPDAALDSVRMGVCDFAVCSWDASAAPPEGLEAMKLWDEPVVVAASIDGPPEDDEVDVADLAHLPFVGVPTDVAYHRIITDQLRAAGVEPLRTVIRLGHAESIKQAVVDNRWVSFAPLYCLRRELEDGRLRAVTVRDLAVVEGIGLYHRPTKFFSSLQRAAIDGLRGRGT